MKRVVWKWVAVFAVLALCLGVSCATAETTKTVSTWADLYTALQDDGTVELGSDLDRNPSANKNHDLIVPTGKTVTLKLNGHTIKNQLSGT